MKSVRIALLTVLCVALLLPGSLPLRSGRRDATAAFAQGQTDPQAPPPQRPPVRRGTKKDGGATQDDQDQPKGQTAIAVAVDLVSLQVLVTDQKGNVVTGLSPQNFTVYEDNVKQ